jgi:hypothetical protein
MEPYIIVLLIGIVMGLMVGVALSRPNIKNHHSLPAG